MKRKRVGLINNIKFPLVTLSQSNNNQTGLHKVLFIQKEFIVLFSIFYI